MWIILYLIFGIVYGTVLFILADYLINLGWNTPRAHFFRVDNSWFDNVINDPETATQYAGTNWYGFSVYGYYHDPIVDAIALLCATKGQSTANDQMISISSTQLPAMMSSYIVSETYNFYFIHGEAHRASACVNDISPWLEPNIPLIVDYTYDSTDVEVWIWGSEMIGKVQVWFNEGWDGYYGQYWHEWNSMGTDYTATTVKNGKDCYYLSNSVVYDEYYTKFKIAVYDTELNHLYTWEPLNYPCYDYPQTG